MPGKASDWDNPEFLLDLIVGLYTGAQSNKSLTPVVKESIEEYIKSRGYTTSFDAHKYFTGEISLCCFSFSTSQLLDDTEQAAFSLINNLKFPFGAPFLVVVTMAKRQIMQWDANVHEDILISLFQHIKPSAEDWSKVMSDLQQKGYSFTEGALRYDF
ncbi:hypothetical protein FBEOM_2002 [Fusarium beomiforme]|uniref:Uncharacterized protein n=1 Tax=Fusarium beomiforme TaxID=44412 RepID=A0A9P5ASW1_9HYPO|nr:hypothetical protein FBEOM_2002 [Fusarium beomiforme]